MENLSDNQCVASLRCFDTNDAIVSCTDGVCWSLQAHINQNLIILRRVQNNYE